MRPPIGKYFFRSNFRNWQGCDYELSSRINQVSLATDLVGNIHQITDPAKVFYRPPLSSFNLVHSFLALVRQKFF